MPLKSLGKSFLEEIRSKAREGAVKAESGKETKYVIYDKPNEKGICYCALEKDSTGAWFEAAHYDKSGKKIKYK